MNYIVYMECAIDVNIEADSPEEARTKVEEMYDTGDIHPAFDYEVAEDNAPEDDARPLPF
jgi:hypothetical protein